MKVIMSVVETVTYSIDVELPNGTDAKKWIKENGEDFWCGVGNTNDYFDSVESRTVSLDRIRT